MDLREKPSLAPHRCKECGHTPPLTQGAKDAKAPYVELTADNNNAYQVERIYLCASCAKKAAELIGKRLGFVLVPSATLEEMRSAAADAETALVLKGEENDRLRNLLLSVVDVAAIAEALEG